MITIDDVIIGVCEANSWGPKIRKLLISKVKQYEFGVFTTVGDIKRAYDKINTVIIKELSIFYRLLFKKYGKKAFDNYLLSLKRTKQSSTGPTTPTQPPSSAAKLE